MLFFSPQNIQIRGLHCRIPYQEQSYLLNGADLGEEWRFLHLHLLAHLHVWERYKKMRKIKWENPSLDNLNLGSSSRPELWKCGCPMWRFSKSPLERTFPPLPQSSPEKIQDLCSASPTSPVHFLSTFQKITRIPVDSSLFLSSACLSIYSLYWLFSRILKGNADKCMHSVLNIYVYI